MYIMMALRARVDREVSCELSYDVRVNHPTHIFEMKVIYYCYFIEV